MDYVSSELLHLEREQESEEGEIDDREIDCCEKGVMDEIEGIERNIEIETNEAPEFEECKLCSELLHLASINDVSSVSEEDEVCGNQLSVDFA